MVGRTVVAAEAAGILCEAGTDKWALHKAALKRAFFSKILRPQPHLKIYAGRLITHTGNPNTHTHTHTHQLTISIHTQAHTQTGTVASHDERN